MNVWWRPAVFYLGSCDAEPGVGQFKPFLRFFSGQSCRLLHLFELLCKLQVDGGQRRETDSVAGKPLLCGEVWFDFERKYCFLCANHLLVKKWKDVEQHIFNIHTLCSRWILVTMIVFWTFYFLLDWRSHVTFLLLLSVCFSKIIPCHLLCIKQIF